MVKEAVVSEEVLTEVELKGGGLFWSVSGKYAVEKVAKIEVIYGNGDEEIIKEVTLLDDGTFRRNIMFEITTLVIEAYDQSGNLLQVIDDLI